MFFIGIILFFRRFFAYIVFLHGKYFGQLIFLLQNYRRLLSFKYPVHYFTPPLRHHFKKPVIEPVSNIQVFSMGSISDSLSSSCKTTGGFSLLNILFTISLLHCVITSRSLL